MKPLKGLSSLLKTLSKGVNLATSAFRKIRGKTPNRELSHKLVRAQLKQNRGDIKSILNTSKGALLKPGIYMIKYRTLDGKGSDSYLVLSYGRALYKCRTTPNTICQMLKIPYGMLPNIIQSWRDAKKLGINLAVDSEHKLKSLVSEYAPIFFRRFVWDNILSTKEIQV